MHFKGYSFGNCGNILLLKCSSVKEVYSLSLLKTVTSVCIPDYYHARNIAHIMPFTVTGMSKIATDDVLKMSKKCKNSKWLNFSFILGIAMEKNAESK